MSITTTTEVTTAHPLTASRAARTGGVVLAVSVVANLLVWLVGTLAGADFQITQAGASETTEVGAALVAFGTLVPLAVGTLALALTSRWGRAAWSTLAWVGLAVGVLTVFMPFTVDAGSGTAIALAAMHLVVGVAWFAALRREI